MKAYYESDGVTIYHGDIREFISARTYQCVVTSPPYNVGMGYDVHDDVMPWGDYWALADRACFVLARFLDDTGRVWLNVAPTVPRNARDSAGKDRVALGVEWTVLLQCAGLNYVDTVSWRQPTRSGSMGCSWGSWQSPSGPNLRGDWEEVIVANKGSWPRTPPPGLERWRDELGGWEGLAKNVWDIPSGSAWSRDHPAVFPVAIPERCIRLSTWPGETVFDPFMGIGTTLVAAKRLGRQAVGVDISERYCEIAARRLDQGVLDFDGAA